MDALFIIPALISPTVPERLIPGLTKMIERNTMLSYSSQIRSAAMRKYVNWFKVATSESDSIDIKNELSEAPIKAGIKDAEVKLGKGAVKVSGPNVEIDPLSTGAAIDADPRVTSPHKVGETEIEVPKGISFFNAVSLEPTLLEIPIEQKRDVLGVSGKSARLLRIGIKCIPYDVEGVTDIKKLLRNSKNLNITTSYLKRRWKSLNKRSILNPTRRRIYRGEESTGNIVTDIIMGPTSEDLSNPRILASLMSTRQSSRWSSVIIFTTIDFRGQEMREIMLQYRDIIKAGWGDMVIVDENREGVYFCTTKTMACSLMPYTYLRQILKMDNVIDYRETSSLTRPFRLVPIRAAVRESRTEYVDDIGELI